MRALGYTQQAFTQRSSYTERLLHSEALHTASFHTENPLHTEAFTHCKLLHTEAFTHRSFYTQPAFTQRNSYTKLGKLLFTESFYTEQTFTQRSPYTEKHLHTEAFTQRSFYTQQTFTHRSFTYSQPSQTEAFTQRSPFTEKHLHREDFAHSMLLNWENPLTILSQPWCGHSNMTYTMSSCKRQWYYARSRGAKQPRSSHYNAICRDWVAKHNRATRTGVRNCSSKTGSRHQSKNKRFRNTCEKVFYKENHQRQNW